MDEHESCLSKRFSWKLWKEDTETAGVVEKFAREPIADGFDWAKDNFEKNTEDQARISNKCGNMVVENNLLSLSQNISQSRVYLVI